MSNAQSKPEGATTILVMGILGLLLCQIFAIVAWVKGNGYLAQCRAMGVEPEATAVWGRILGIVGTILMIIAIIGVVIAIVAAVMSGGNAGPAGVPVMRP